MDVKAEQVATFLGRKLVGQFQGEVGNNFNTRIQGTCIRHRMGPNSIKLYDKHGIMMRVECTSNNVSSFRLPRQVKQRNGETVTRVAPLPKSIYSLPTLRKLMGDANRRYCEYIAAIENPTSGQKACDKPVLSPVEALSASAKEKNRSYRGFNLFLKQDFELLATLMRGEWAISGLRAKDLRAHIKGLNASRCSFIIKRLRTHGIIRKVGHCYKYYLTNFGKQVLATVMKLKQELIIPVLGEAHT